VPARRRQGQAIDLERARAIAFETGQAQDILGDIFEPAATRQAGEPQDQQSDTDRAGKRAGEEAGEETASGLPGLAMRYQNIAAALRGHDVMTRSDFDAMARALELLPEGVIDAINEWSLEQFDRPAIEESGTNIHIDGSCFSTADA